MRNNLLKPVNKDKDLLIEFSDSVILDKKILITVPSTYTAITFIDEVPSSRIDECDNESLFVLLGKDKELLKRNVKVAFIKTGSLPILFWGFGQSSIRVKEETYVFGSNGEIELSVKDRIKLINTFGLNNISIQDIQNRLLGNIKNVGIRVFNTYLSLNNIQSSDIDKHIGILRKLFIEELKKELVFESVGLELVNLNIKSILKTDVVNIKESNNQSFLKELELFKEEMINKINSISNNSFSSKELELLKEEIISQIPKTNIDSVSQTEFSLLKEELYNSLSNNKEELLDSVKRIVSEEENRINKNVDSKFDSIREIIESTKEEREINNLELYEKAKTEAIKDLKITTDLLIDNSDSDEDLAAPASIIYSNVEKNLIENCEGLMNNGDVFYASEEDFDDMCVEMFKSGNRISFPKEFLKDSSKYVIMPVVFRFMMYGLSVPNALKAQTEWRFLNRCRHFSQENQTILDKELKKRGITRKQFLKNTLKLYREFKLFIKD